MTYIFVLSIGIKKMTEIGLKEIRKHLPRGYLTIQDEQILYGFAKDKNVLEIGTHLGRSAALMSFVSKSIVTIDIFELEGYIRDTDSTYEEAKKNLSKYKNIKIIEGVSHEIVKTLERDFFDFLFIDGNHYYVDVLLDFVTFYPIMKKDSHILFHDYNVNFPGVVEAVDDLSLKYNLIDLELNRCIEGTKIKGFKIL